MRLIRPLSIVVVLTLLASSAPLEARNEAGDWELGVHLGRTRFFDSDELDNDGFWGVNVGYAFSDIFEVAVNYDSVSTDGGDDIPDADLDFLTLDFILNGGKDAHRPFFLFGVGNIDQNRLVRTPSGNERIRRNTGVIDVGLGYRGYFTRLAGIRLDARLYFTDKDGSGFGVQAKDLRISYGLVFNIHR
jgi:hypothetical protein